MQNVQDELGNQKICLDQTIGMECQIQHRWRIKTRSRSKRRIGTDLVRPRRL